MARKTRPKTEILTDIDPGPDIPEEPKTPDCVPYSRHQFEAAERRAAARIWRDTQVVSEHDSESEQSDSRSACSSTSSVRRLEGLWGKEGNGVIGYMKQVGKLRKEVEKLSQSFKSLKRTGGDRSDNEKPDCKPNTDSPGSPIIAPAQQNPRDMSEVESGDGQPVVESSGSPEEINVEMSCIQTQEIEVDVQAGGERADNKASMTDNVLQTVGSDAEALDTPGTEGSDGRAEGSQPFNPSETEGSRFELATHCFYRHDPASNCAYLSTDTYSFIRIKYDSSRTEEASGEIYEIMIESPVFMAYFNDLTGQDVSSVETQDNRMLRFMQPFRWLIQYADTFRQKASELNTNGTLNEPTIGPASVDIPNDGVTVDDSSKTIGPEMSAEFDLQGQLTYLSAFIEKHLSHQLATYRAYRNAESKTITFDNLWALFLPGNVIYSPQRLAPTVHDYHGRGEPIARKESIVSQAYHVLSVTGGRRIVDKLKSEPMSVTYKNLDILVYYIDFDGSALGAVSDHFTFRPYEGTREVTELECYPLNYVASKSDPSNAANFLDERGTTFLNICQNSHRLYEGLTIGKHREEINTAVVIDFKTAHQQMDGPPVFGTLTDEMLKSIESNNYDRHEIFEITTRAINPNFDFDEYFQLQASLLSSLSKRFWDTVSEYPTVESWKEGDFDIVDALTRAGHLALLPGAVYGFALRNRRWMHLDVSLVQKLSFEAEWNDLVLPEGHKEMVRAVVENHAAGSRAAHRGSRGPPELDIVRGKGKGCIILLHGEPGVGKTSTAECVASFTKKPLFPITCGDIGYEPSEVESNLEKHFNLAHKWGCVMLLDEADVFLAKRNREDLKRNGLVSVFLRTLEYYPGILFLTTNRIGAFDDAFRSRIHLSLYYPKLDKDQTIAIWKMNLRRVETLNIHRERDGKTGVKVNKNKIMRFVKDNWDELKWNGRQIRNAVQTAVALADFDARPDDPDDPQKKTKDIKKEKSLNKSDTKLENEQAKPNGEVHGEMKAPKRTQSKLSTKHFETIANASKAFDNYLFSTHGMDEATLAHRNKERYDYVEVKEIPYKPRDFRRGHGHRGDSKKKKKQKYVEVSSSSSSTSETSSSSENSEEEDDADVSSDEDADRRRKRNKNADDSDEETSTSEQDGSDSASDEDERKSSKKSKKDSSKKKEKSKDEKKSKSKKEKDGEGKKSKSKPKKEKA